MIYAKRIHVINEINERCAYSGFKNLNRNMNQEREQDEQMKRREMTFYSYVPNNAISQDIERNIVI